MPHKKTGNLFQGIFDKSPEIAQRLESLGTKKKEGEKKNSGKAGRKPNKHKDPMAGVLVEKRSIIPRQQAQSNKRKKNWEKSGNAKNDAKMHSKAVEQTEPMSAQKDNKDENRFFPNIPENAHQFENPDDPTPLDVVIGLDFGTSSTKVVIRTPYHTGEPTYAVPFGDLAHESLPYLLPTRLYIGDNDACWLRPIPGISALTDIKTSILDNPNSSIETVDGASSRVSAITVATCYLALTLRYVRSWFLFSKGQTFGGKHLRWAWNLGLPASVDDDENLRNTYEQIGKVAWVASKRQGPISIKKVNEVLEDVKCDRCDVEENPADFHLVPEVIAEVTGYARSKHRDPGLHLVIDIGAGTLDVCTFILHEEDGEDIYPILTADIARLGSGMFHSSRIDGAKSAITEHSHSFFDASDPLHPIPEDHHKYIPDDDYISDHIADAEKAFIHKCYLFLNKSIWYVKKKKDLWSLRWSEKLPVFFCGGASALDVYKTATNQAGDLLKEYLKSSKGLRLISLPKPENFDADGIDDKNFHRLAVAWGLSMEPDNRGTYCRPSEIDDIPSLPVRDVGGAFVSKDMV